MSHFLSNLISRYAQSENIVRPRSPGIFENHTTWLEPGSTSFSPENVEGTTQIISSEVEKTRPRINLISKNESPENTSLQQENIHEDEDKQPGLNNLHNNKEYAINYPVNNNNLNNEEFITRNNASENEKEQMKYNTRGERHLSEQKNNVSSRNLSKDDMNSTSKQNAKQIGFHVYSRQSPPILPKKINHPYSSKLNPVRQNNMEPINSVKASLSEQSTPIKIHIGRIEIKAVNQNQAKTKSIKRENNQGSSLEQFLKKRGGKAQ